MNATDDPGDVGFAVHVPDMLIAFGEALGGVCQCGASLPPRSVDGQRLHPNYARIRYTAPAASP